MKEYKDLTADPLQDTITAGPVSEDNMLEWEALIQGPEDTPYVSDCAGRTECDFGRVVAVCVADMVLALMSRKEASSLPSSSL